MTNGRIAVITGATRGLGLETAKQLAKKNYQVVITGRNEAKGKQIQSELAQQNIKVAFLILDVANPQSIEDFSKAVIAQFKRVDILVNNAGILIDHDRTYHHLSDYADIIENTFKTNAVGPFLLCQSLVPSMIKNNFGRVINISSELGQLCEMNSGYSGYRMSKTALNAVTKMFADMAKGTNVLVNSVCPGWVRTDMGGPHAPRTLEQGVDTIVWLATEENSASGGFYRDRQLISW